MNAIDLLEAQHREVEDLFSKLEGTKDAAKREAIFVQLADSLAIHTTIEEHHFYPAIREKGAEDGAFETFEDHLSIKRALGALLDVDVDDETFEEKLEILEAEVEHHVEQEEGDLFPRVMRLFDENELEDVGDAMSAEQSELEERGNARETVPEELENRAPV
ncbi:MAG TPA: hemerythrin domain-containing protein [Polyangia bacterium]|nr:hemerythrin domain-containing protein [Polyangia bacterium]